MPETLRVALASYGPEQFQLLHSVCVDSGHSPIGYLLSRSLRPRGRPEGGDIGVIVRVLRSLPPGTDLLLPATGAGVARALAGYRPDLLVVFGFNWRLPPEVLALPRLGVLNVHPSALPRYRGPAPMLWAIRNGDPVIGVTIHRMDEGLDTGPVLALRDNIPMPDDATPETVWEQTRPVIAELLVTALDRAAAGDPGTPQDETLATYAGFAPEDWQIIDWTGERYRIHHQIRVLRYMSNGTGPVVEIEDARLLVRRTSLEPAPGIRVDCGDGPLWITSWDPVAAAAAVP
jgi:methionyl-tRNA formyltransferase